MNLTSILFFAVIGLILFLIFKKKKQNSSTVSTEESEENAGNETRQERYTKNRLLVWFSAIAISTTIILITFTFWPTENAPDPVLGTVLFVLFFLIASWRILGPTEIGVVMLLGREMYNVRSGPVFVPWIICSLVRESRLVIEHEIPAEPEKVWRAKRGEPDVIPNELVKEGYKPAVRVTFTTEKEDGVGKREFSDPLKERLTAEVPGIIRWKIIDFMTFLTTIESRDEAHRQMEDVYVSLISRELSKVSLEKAIENRGKYDGEIATALKEATKNWGIAIETAVIKGILLSHELNSKIQLMAEAVAEKRTSLLQGEGQGAKEKAILDGRTAGLENMQKRVTSEMILSSETAREVAKSVNTLVAVGQGGMADLMGIVTAGAHVLKASGEKNSDETPKEGGAT